MVSTVKPKASATPAKPMPATGKPAARTALPQPPKTSQKVPRNSASPRCVFVIIASTPLGASLRGEVSARSYSVKPSVAVRGAAQAIVDRDAEAGLGHRRDGDARLVRRIRPVK